MANASPSPFFAGLDIGGTTVKAVLVDHQGTQAGPLTEVRSLVKDGYEATFGQLSLALDQLADQYKAYGYEDRFLAMRPILLTPHKGETVEKDLARKLGMTEVNIRTTLKRLRSDFRDLVRAEVARIVDDPADIDDEIAYLLRALKE